MSKTIFEGSLALSMDRDPKTSLQRARWIVLLGLAVTIGAQPPKVGAQSPAIGHKLRALASTELTNEMLLSSSTEGGQWGSDQVSIEQGPRIASVTIWRGVAGSRFYLVVEHADTLYLAGGFTQPNFVAIDRLIGRTEECSSLTERANCLATLLDPYGAVQMIAPFSGTDMPTPAVGAWNEIKPRDWPSDTLITGPGNRTSVVVTLFTRNLGNFDQAWTAIAHGFTFDNGDLVAWVSRESSPFSFRLVRN